MPEDLAGSIAEKFYRGDIGELHIDSRNIKKGDAFIALPGTKVHGNQFVEAALKRGAKLIIVDQKAPYKKARQVVAVPQPAKFLLKVARAMVYLSDAKRVGITGSNGKTTTKDLTALALGGEGKRVLKTHGNYNNHLGVPLTLCRLRHHHKFAVIEMGTSGVGEIKTLTQLVKPHISVLTAVNAAHMEGLKTLQAVAGRKKPPFLEG